MELSQQGSDLHPMKGLNLEKHVSILYYMSMKEGEWKAKSEVLNGKDHRVELSWEQHMKFPPESIARVDAGVSNTRIHECSLDSRLDGQFSKFPAQTFLNVFTCLAFH